jgi:hypothetical protein
MGDLESRAASSEATTVELLVTFVAGMANCFSFAYLKSLRTSSPVQTIVCQPTAGFREFADVEIRTATDRR